MQSALSFIRQRQLGAYLILFTLLLVHLILRISPHRSSPSSLSPSIVLIRSFTPYLKFICSTNPFLHSLSGSIWTGSTDLGPHGPDWTNLALAFCLFLVFFFFLATRALTKLHDHTVVQFYSNSRMTSYQSYQSNRSTPVNIAFVRSTE